MAEVRVDMEENLGKGKQAVLLKTQNLNYHVTVSDKSKSRRCCGLMSRPDKTRQILEDINIVALPGQLTAIMGPSGSGKTSLLELISARVQGNTTGSIQLNGTPATPKIMSKIAGYVKQKDILLPSATVKEAIQFSADLRLPASMSASARKAKVEQIIENLGLVKCQDTKVGDDKTRGVSGGELKRTAIGVELITDPRLLFLDEPTSGLDSSSAFTIVDTLKNLARKDGTTVVCTLHQPRSNIFYLFDRLILMYNGRILFQGTPPDAIEFFKECGHECPQFTNPPDFFMDVITDTEIPTSSDDAQNLSESSSSTNQTRPLLGSKEEDFGRDNLTSPDTPKRKRTKKKSSQKTSDGEQEEEMAVMNTQMEKKEAKMPDSVNQMIERWNSSKKSKRATKIRKEYPPLDLSSQGRNAKPGMFRQFLILFKRSWTNNIRNPLILYAQLFQHIFLSIFLGLMYLRIGKKPDALMDRSAAIFFSLLNVSWIPALTAAFVFPAERPLFNRERAGGFYKTLPYYLATTLSDQPLQILFVVLNSVVIYWMLWLNPSFERFVIYVLIVLITLILTQSIALLLSALSPSADVANLLAGLVLLLFMAFGGFLLSSDNVPKYFYPIEYTSPYKYSFRALMQNDLKGMTFNCPDTIGPCPIGNYTFTTPSTMNETGILAPDQDCTYPCLLKTGEKALQAFGYAKSSVLEDVMILLGMTIIYRILIYVVLEFVQVGGS